MKDRAPTSSSTVGVVLVAAVGVSSLLLQGCGGGSGSDDAHTCSSTSKQCCPQSQLVEKSVNVDDLVLKDGTIDQSIIRIGGDGLPPQMQGAFWLTGQGSSSSVMSFAKSQDGCGISSGRLADGKDNYAVRVGGDRTWFFNDKAAGWKMAKFLDLAYHFQVTKGTTYNPTSFQIIPQGKNLADLRVDAEWILDFDADLLMNDNDEFDYKREEFPGSAAWGRPSSFAGIEIKSSRYILVQIVDAKGKPIQPAYDKWIAYSKSPKAGSTPGILHYHEAAESEDKVTESFKKQMAAAEKQSSEAVKCCEAPKQPCKGVFTSNVYKSYEDSGPWRIGDVWVFGHLEGTGKSAWFKMVSVDRKGKKIESRHSPTALTDSMTSAELKEVWDAAFNGGDYTAKVTKFCIEAPRVPCKGVLTSNVMKSYEHAGPWRVGEVFVFGAMEGKGKDAWFKMVSVDSEGKKIESRHSVDALKDTMAEEELLSVWDAAFKGGDYHVNVTQFCQEAEQDADECLFGAAQDANGGQSFAEGEVLSLQCPKSDMFGKEAVEREDTEKKTIKTVRDKDVASHAEKDEDVSSHAEKDDASAELASSHNANDRDAESQRVDAADAKDVESQPADTADAKDGERAPVGWDTQSFANGGNGHEEASKEMARNARERQRAGNEQTIADEREMSRSGKQSRLYTSQRISSKSGYVSYGTFLAIACAVASIAFFLVLGRRHAAARRSDTRVLDLEDEGEE